jgi:RimJ/RimL family protein N-acetyltransferase
VSSFSGTPPTISTRQEDRFRFIYGEDQRIGEWARAHAVDGRLWNGDYVAIGLECEGKLIAGVAYTDWYGGSISGHITAIAPLPRQFVRRIFVYPFLQLKVRRFSALIPAKHDKANAFVRRLGFTMECVMKDVFVADDLNVWRMYRDECRWL